MRIGFATQDPGSHYWLIVSHGARARAAEMGVEILIVPSETLEQQLAAINSFIDQRVDALLVGPVRAVGLAGAVARAQAAGIPVIVLATQLNDCEATCTVQSDHERGAELAAAHVVEQIGGAGAVAHLVGPSRLQDNIDRARGVRKVLSQHPQVQLVYEQESPDWHPASAEALMRAALERHPDLRGVCVANDTLALGTLSAIERAERSGEIVVTGFDATPEALLAIHEGRMSGTVLQATREIGRTGLELAQRAAAGEAVPPRVFMDISLITRANLVEALLESAQLLPGVLSDAVQRGEELARARDEIIDAQKAVLRELSSPLIPLSDTVMIMPLIGTIDSARAQQIIETLLHGVASNGITTLILDITGVTIVDTQIANALIQASQSVRLLGAEVVLTGIRPEIAQTLIGLGINLSAITTLGTLQSGITYAMGGAARR